MTKLIIMVGTNAKGLKLRVQSCVIYLQWRKLQMGRNVNAESSSNRHLSFTL